LENHGSKGSAEKKRVEQLRRKKGRTKPLVSITKVRIELLTVMGNKRKGAIRSV